MTAGISYIGNVSSYSLVHLDILYSVHHFKKLCLIGYGSKIFYRVNRS